MSRDKVLDWLLEPDQPSVRYLALTQLLGKSETDSDVKHAKARIPSAGWAAEMLARSDPAGWWVRDAHPMSPKYVAMNWNLLALSDLGATRAIPEGRVLRTLDGEVPAERRWCGRHVERAWSPLLHRQHDPRADSHGVRRRPPGPQGARLAGPDRPPERRLDLLELQRRARDGTDPRLVGGPERLRRLSPLEVDGGREGMCRARGRVLSRPRVAPTGSAVRAVVPVPLADALLLRPLGGPRRPDRSRVRARPEARLRARPPTEEATLRRALEPRRGPTGPEPGGRQMVCGTSEQASNPARVRDRGPPEQDDH